MPLGLQLLPRTRWNHPTASAIRGRICTSLPPPSEPLPSGVSLTTAPTILKPIRWGIARFHGQFSTPTITLNARQLPLLTIAKPFRPSEHGSQSGRVTVYVELAPTVDLIDVCRGEVSEFEEFEDRGDTAASAAFGRAVVEV